MTGTGGIAGMWCPRCHTEVAAEIAPNGQSLNCVACGTEIQRIYAPSLHPDTRSARELLDRWSKNDLLNPPAASETQAEESQPTPTPQVVETHSLPNRSGIPSEALSSAESESEMSSTRRDRPERGKPDRPAPKPRTTWRVDAPHNITQPVAPPPPPVPPRRPHFSAVIGDEESSETVAKSSAESVVTTPSLKESAPTSRPIPAEPVAAEPVSSAVPPQQRSEAHDSLGVAPQASTLRMAQHRLDPPHEAMNRPHFDLHSFLTQDSRKPGRSESIWGQILAYLGVGLITVGTTLVLWGWFGKTPDYAQTGWLVCTIGQMLLFLGVITLISGGIQQTSHEVTRRVEFLGDRILRFEQSTEELLRGPHYLDRSNATKHESTRANSTDAG